MLIGIQSNVKLDRLKIKINTCAKEIFKTIIMKMVVTFVRVMMFILMIQQLMGDEINDFIARKVFTICILCLLPDDRRSYLSCKKT